MRTTRRPVDLLQNLWRYAWVVVWCGVVVVIIIIVVIFMVIMIVMMMMTMTLLQVLVCKDFARLDRPPTIHEEGGLYPFTLVTVDKVQCECVC